MKVLRGNILAQRVVKKVCDRLQYRKHSVMISYEWGIPVLTLYHGDNWALKFILESRKSSWVLTIDTISQRKKKVIKKSKVPMKALADHLVVLTTQWVMAFREYHKTEKCVLAMDWA